MENNSGGRWEENSKQIAAFKQRGRFVYDVGVSVMRYSKVERVYDKVHRQGSSRSCP